jgi:probable HAF family extracellular repeat protein
VLLAAGCTDNLITEPASASFDHSPGHGTRGGNKGGDDSGTAYAVSLLGTLGGSTSLALAINNGAFVVGEAANAAGQTRAFVWTESEGMRDLLGSGHAPSSGARHINQAGKVTGLSRDHSAASSFGFVHDLATSHSTWLPPLPGHTTTQGIAINTDGIVVGRSAAGTQWRTVAWVPAPDGSYSDPIDLDCPAMQE